MGYAYIELIVPALLYLNPGISKEKLANLLGEIHFSSFAQHSYDKPLDYYDKDEHERKFNGLERIAQSFGLLKTKKFKEFQSNKIDEHGLKINSPFLIRTDYVNQHFGVQVHKANTLGRTKKIHDECSYEKLSIGNLFYSMLGNQGIVKEILKEKKISDKEEDFMPSPNYIYDLKIIPIKPVIVLETFNSEKEVYLKYPLFNPIKKYDWSKRKGVIKTGFLSEDKYLWKKEKNKYYLDEKTFDNLCECFTTGFSFGYTDLIVTSEAIKNKAWKLFSYKGFVHIDDFLKAFPSSDGIYKKAVYDAHFSIFAKQQKMTNSDLMRFRLMYKFKG